MRVRVCKGPSVDSRRGHEICSPVARHISSASMAEQSPHSALLSAGLVGTPNPYLARYRAGARAQDGVAEDAPIPSSARSDATIRSGQSPSPSLDASVRLCDALLSELNPDSLLSVPTATFSSKFSTRATVCCCPFFVPYSTFCVLTSCAGACAVHAINSLERRWV